MNPPTHHRAEVEVTEAARHRAGTPVRGRRGRKAALAGLAVTGLVSSVFVGSGIANAAPLPNFPDNIVTFPDRDMITAEGFSGDLTVKVYRGTELMGAARGTGPDFEVNHPGGACWGQDMVDPTNTSFPQVTPDIKGGDRIVIERLENGTPVEVAESIVQDAAVEANGVHYTDGATTFTITGTVAAGIPAANLEQRIVNAGLTDTPVARRDIRAVVTDGNVMEAAPNGGYSSRLEVTAGKFTAYYDFAASDNPDTATNEAVETARIAATTDIQRLLSWQLADGAANRQGLTIAEQGEAGGPGMGGCPSGPGSAAATPGSYSVVWSNTTAQVNWTPAVSQPGAPGVSAYSIEAVGTTATAGEFTVTGKRAASTATRSTLSGLTGGSAAWKIEVRPITGTSTMEAPFPLASGATAPATPGDTTAPTVTATQSTTNGAVTLKANEANVDMYYTTDGSRPNENGSRLPSATAKLYTAPIAITAPTNLRWVGYDLAGNVSALGQKNFSPVTVQASPPGVPAGLTATPGVGKVDLKWTAPANTGGAPIDKYTVRYTAPAVVGTGTDAAPQVPAVDKTVDSTTTSASVIGLDNAREYTFTVTATNVAGTSGESNAIKARPGDAVSISIARNKAGDIRLTGTGSTTTASYKVYLSKTAADVGNPTATGTVQLSNATNLTITPAVAPATGVGWELKKKDAVGPPVNSTTLPRGYVVWIQSTEGGLASAPVT